MKKIIAFLFVMLVSIFCFTKISSSSMMVLDPVDVSGINNPDPSEGT